MEIRRALTTDKDKIIQFIEKYWDKNHIFVKSPDLFEYQYRSNEYINFILAIEDERVVSILGYIVYSKEYTNSDIFLAMWMTSPEIKSGTFGLKLNQFLLDGNFRSVSCCGIAKKVIPLYTFLGYKTGKLNHYYMVNPLKHIFEIADIVSNPTTLLEVKATKNIDRFIPISSSEELKEKFNIEQFNNRYFYKDYDYLKQRYFLHPMYQYKIFGIQNDKNFINSIVIGREVYVGKAKVFRVVDFIGNESDLSVVKYDFQKLIIENDYEYIDFYQFGIDQSVMEAAGFTLREKEDKNIIPNYFEPFEKKNVDIYFSTTIKEEPFYMFKGDGDQDRPNLLTEELG